jgi:radical SAM protein with 4Fe4S-binding SPASM domain
MKKKVKNRYNFLRRVANRLHEISPFFHFTKRISRPFKIMRLRRKIARIQLPESPLENDPLFTSVEIETINRCNGNCGFCPVNHKQDPRHFKKMSKELFFKIINELASINFEHGVNLYSNNEPLLDTRIYEFAEYAKSKLPSAQVIIYTNGTLLTVEKFKRLIESLDFLVIDNYCNDYKLKPNLLEVARFIDSRPDLWKKTDLIIRYEKELLTTRGGQAPNAYHKHKNPISVGCRQLSNQMIIRPDGKVSLCCNDALGTVTLGDVKTEGLVEIWNKPATRSIRRNVLRSRTYFEICKGCDTCY